MSESVSVQRSQALVRSVPRTIQNTVTCSICHALYAPSHLYDNLLQAPLPVLESAFMGMCHFCFRCRRPACPQCWDDVNGICACCVQETKLVFRTASPLISDALFSPQRRAQAVREQKRSAPLVCIQPGMFQDSSTAPTSAPAVALSTDPVKALPPLPAPSTPLPLEATPKSSPTPSDKATQKPASAPPTPPSTPTKVNISSSRRTRRPVMRVLMVILALVLALVVLLAVVAMVSSDANSFIARTINIDIRAVIAYLLQLIQQIQ